MSKWYRAVTSDLGKLPEFISHFEEELVEAKKELSMRGKSLEKHAAELPGIVENRFNQLQEIEAVLEHVNLLKYKTRSKRTKHYFEGYAKALSFREAEKYAEGDKEYYDVCVLVNEVSLLRNQFLGIHKGLDQKSWQLGNITRLRCAGLDDAHM